jgi:YegS/Rv2252/BmrU family lipid kinase
VGKIAVVLNASSGHGAAVKVAARLQEIFGAAGREADIALARNGAELRSAVRKAVEDGCETLVAGGGDGTINTAASAIVGREITLGVLPLGTLNHFAKDLGIPLNLEEAAKIIVDGTWCRVDLGEVNGRFFLNNSSLGVYPAIVRLRERYRATFRGKWIAACWAALTVMRRNPFMAVKLHVEGKESIRRTPLVLVSNNEYRTTGIHAGTRESITRGQLVLYVLNAERRQGLLGLALKTILEGAERVKELDLFTVEQVAVETRRRRLQVALDGEVMTLDSPLHYQSRTKALKVFVPATTSACNPGAS